MKKGAQISRLLQELLGAPNARQVAPLATEGRRSESQVEDVRAARKEIKSHGVEFVTDVNGNESEAWTYFRGPDGYLYELWQTVRPWNAQPPAS
jgi:hypothetical protein